MPRYSLRTLLILMAIVPPALAVTYWAQSGGEAFMYLLLGGLFILAICGILIEERDSRQQRVRDRRK
jgi:hypothetical protein